MLTGTSSDVRATLLRRLAHLALFATDTLHACHDTDELLYCLELSLTTANILSKMAPSIVYVFAAQSVAQLGTDWGKPWLLPSEINSF